MKGKAMGISMNLNNVNFKSNYQVNANEYLQDNNKKCMERDFILGAWKAKANNGEKLTTECHDFLSGEYKKNPEANFYQVYELDDKYDKDFEESLKAVGQSFNKIA